MSIGWIDESSTPLPVTRPLLRLRSNRRAGDYHRKLRSVRLAAVVLTPRHFSGVGGKVATGDVVVNANLGATDAAKEALRLIGAGAVLGIGFLMVDPLYREGGGQLVPMARFIGVNG